MNEARPFASLSSGLLARKGAAKPAMRPQGFGMGGFEDLGWNDMGHHEPHEDEGDLPEHVPSSIAALTPAPKLIRAEDEPAARQEREPDVVAQQRAIAESFEAEEAQAEFAPEIEAETAPDLEAEAVAAEAPAPAQAPVRARAQADIVALPKRAPAPAAGGRKAAFTLRLDAERHFRLRLATAVTGRSAQQIVTSALDELLASIPEVEALAGRVPAKAKRS